MTQCAIFNKIRVSMSTETRIVSGSWFNPEANRIKIANPARELKKPIDGLPFVDLIDQNSGARFASAGALDGRSIDFGYIANLIRSEADMSPRSESELKTSWDSGLAVVVMKKGKTVGYSRLIEKGYLTAGSEAEREILGLAKKRRVYEIGSVILEPEVRELHLGRPMLEAVMSLRLDEVKRGEAVFISTTNVSEKSRFPTSLGNAAETLGIRFIPIIHTDIKEGVEAACKGCPMHKGSYCPNRVTRENLLRLELGRPPQGKENCVLYVSRTDGVPEGTVVFDAKAHANGTNGVNHANI